MQIICKVLGLRSPPLVYVAGCGTDAGMRFLAYCDCTFHAVVQPAEFLKLGSAGLFAFAEIHDSVMRKIAAF